MTPSRTALVLLLAAAPAWAGEAETAARTGDPNLHEAVQGIAAHVESVRGESFLRPPVAVRAPDDMRRIATEIRAFNVLSRGRLAARGRAWADLGLGGEGSPRALLLTLAGDLDGVGFDPQGNRLLVSTERLSDLDFEPSEEETDHATILMLTGVRPDEPLIGHALMHVRQRERTGRDAMEPTTDGLLAAMAWSEGEANLVAMRMLFEGMGLADEVVGPRLHPGEVLDGGLMPPGMDRLSGVERGFVRFVYLDGFDRAAERYRAGGWKTLDQAMDRHRTTRDLLHPANDSTLPIVFPEPEPPAVAGLELADEDSLGEQAIVVLVSTLTGKDSLGMVAGEGWTGDRLYRWEPGSGAGSTGGITEWVTRWASEEAAADFDYAIGRTLEARFPGRAVATVGPGRRVLATGVRTYRIDRFADEVRIRIAPSDWDSRLEADGGES